MNKTITKSYLEKLIKKHKKNELEKILKINRYRLNILLNKYDLIFTNYKSYNTALFFKKIDDIKFTELYLNFENKDLANKFNISIQTLRNRAKSLNLKKYKCKEK